MPLNKPRTFETAVTKWIQGRQVSIYVHHRKSPLTGLTVCSMNEAVWVCRWNGSTHLIPTREISYLRFPPGGDPYDHPDHPLHPTVRTGLKRTGRAAPVGIPPGLKQGDALSLGDILEPLMAQKGG